MRDHFIVTGCGALCDTRRPAWHTLAPLRENYSKSHRHIKTAADLKASIRAGEYSWPGGYALFFVTDDGASLSFAAVIKNYSSVLHSVKTGLNDGWRVIGLDSVENSKWLVYCDHTGEQIK